VSDDGAVINAASVCGHSLCAVVRVHPVHHC
jgi:hypothetical protein